MLLGWCQVTVGRARRRSPPGRARLGPGPHARGSHGHHATWLVPSSGGEGATPIPTPGRARPWQGPHVCGCQGHHATRLVPSSKKGGGRDATPRRAEPCSGRGPTCVGAPAIALLGWCRAREEGANAASRRAEPGSGRDPTCVGAPVTLPRPAVLLGWRRAAEGRARHSSPPGRARLGPGPHVCGRHGLCATRLVPIPHKWLQRPTCYLVGAK